MKTLSNKDFWWNSQRRVIFLLALFCVIATGNRAVADINDQVAQLDFDTATLDDIIDIFGEPVKYHWEGQTYTRDNLPDVYIVQYPNEFGIVMFNGYIGELRFESPAAGYVFQNQIVVGSSLDDVLAVVGAPTETIVGQPCGWQDGVLYKDLDGVVGHCYYLRSDQGVRFFFWNYHVSALYLPADTGGSPPPLTEVNPFDDVRWEDLGQLDLSDRLGLIETLTFNMETVWPEPGMMPPGDGPDEIMTKGMNPGLGVRGLHQQGITGAGVNVAIIDQPLYQDHPEYAGKVVAYYDLCGGAQSSMHGPAVTSLLAGANCGTAPGARIYYAAAPSWTLDAAYYADALDWIVAQNEILPASEKIRVVSVSAAPSGPGSPFLYNTERWDEACTRAEAAGILIIDCTSQREITFCCYYDPNDPEDMSKCTRGWPDQTVPVWPEIIHVPTSLRTLAEADDVGDCFGYTYDGHGGMSWSVPYCAGVLALGWQIRPEITGEQMVDFLFQTAYIKENGAKIINPPAFIALLEANAPTIKLSAEEFVFSAVSDGPVPESQVLSISNSGLGTLNWQISGSCGWLDVNPASGTSTGPADVDDVTLTVMDISPGIHSCQLTILNPCATNSPQTVLITLYVSDANAPTIQSAIDAAEEGDTVVIEPGVYMGDGNRDLDFKGKAITLRSIDPDDPEIVASTVIFCQGSDTENHRGFRFHNNEGADSVLDGFTITGGYASYGGAIRCRNSSPMIANCVFEDNLCSVTGGAMENDKNSNPSLTNCVFRNNSSEWIAGAVRNHTSSPVFINCLFTGNTALAGGAMRNENDRSNPTLINCTFADNKAAGWASGIFNGDINTSPIIKNCIFWNNQDAGGGDQSAQIYEGSPVINYSCIQGWTGTLGGVGNMGDDPCFVDPDNGDYHLRFDSPGIDAGTDAGVYEDMEGRVRPFDCPWADHNAELDEFDMGAYEYFAAEFSMQVTPQALNPGSHGRWVKAHFVLPEGYAVEDVDVTRPAVMEPLGVSSESICAFVNYDEGLTAIEVRFRRSEVVENLPGGDTLELHVLAYLVGGEPFYGTDTIRIVGRREELFLGLSAHWLETADAPGWDCEYDLDQDGVINLKDFALLLQEQ